MKFRVKDTDFNRTWFPKIIGKIFWYYSHPKGCAVEYVLPDQPDEEPPNKEGDR